MVSKISLGSRGPDVTRVQSLLNGRSPSMLPRLVEDGKFGPGTRARVEEFQRQNGLETDGVVGPLTLAALEGRLAPVNPARAFEALTPLFYTARVIVRGDPYRLALVVRLESALQNASRQPTGNLVGTTMILTNPLFWILVIIILLALVLVTDPVHRANLTKMVTLVVEAVEARGEEAARKARVIAEAVKAFWRSLTDPKTECERLADPAKLAECLRKFEGARKAAFGRLLRAINMLLTIRYDQWGRGGLLDIPKALLELARAVKAYVDALNDLLRCLECPEIPYPDIPGLPITD